MATTSKKINFLQLNQELNNIGLSWDDNDPDNKIITLPDNSTVSEAELEAAIAAHIAGPTQQELRMLNRQEGLAKLKELGFTDEQISALLS